MSAKQTTPQGSSDDKPCALMAHSERDEDYSGEGSFEPQDFSMTPVDFVQDGSPTAQLLANLMKNQPGLSVFPKEANLDFGPSSQGEESTITTPIKRAVADSAVGALIMEEALNWMENKEDVDEDLYHRLMETWTNYSNSVLASLKFAFQLEKAFASIQDRKAVVDVERLMQRHGLRKPKETAAATTSAAASPVSTVAATTTTTASTTTGITTVPAGPLDTKAKFQSAFWHFVFLEEGLAAYVKNWKSTTDPAVYENFYKQTRELLVRIQNSPCLPRGEFLMHLDYMDEVQRLRPVLVNNQPLRALLAEQCHNGMCYLKAAAITAFAK